jgi:hypothetical protein
MMDGLLNTCCRYHVVGRSRGRHLDPEVAQQILALDLSPNERPTTGIASTPDPLGKLQLVDVAVSLEHGQLELIKPTSPFAEESLLRCALLTQSLDEILAMLQLLGASLQAREQGSAITLEIKLLELLPADRDATICWDGLELMADPRENLLVCTVFLCERFQDAFNVRDHSVELTDRSTDAACLTFRCLDLVSDGFEPNLVWKRPRHSSRTIPTLAAR